jgi:hypothetical protein
MGGVRQLAAVVTAAATLGSCLGAAPAVAGHAGSRLGPSRILNREYVMVASKAAGQQESNRPVQEKVAGVGGGQEKETRPERGESFVKKPVIPLLC